MFIVIFAPKKRLMVLCWWNIECELAMLDRVRGIDRE